MSKLSISVPKHHKTVFIRTYGCQMNERDSENLATCLQNKGWEIVDSEEKANIFLLNSCSIRDLSEQKILGKVGRGERKIKTNPSYILGVMGCMAQLWGDALQHKFPFLKLVVGTHQWHRIPEFLDQLLLDSSLRICNTDIDPFWGQQKQMVPFSSQKVTAYITIMQGCNSRCSYCIVPSTRGKEQSRPLEAILEEAHTLVDQGVREITFLGQIVNRYGKDLSKEKQKSLFIELLEKLHAIDGLYRIRFLSPSPSWFGQDLVQVFGRLQKLCPQIHLPIQSGSNAVLKDMKRTYTSETFFKLIDSLREVRPDMVFSTDYIVGYPGETEEDFLQSCQSFEKAQLERAFVFKFSSRRGTLAAEHKNPISEIVKAERNQRFLEIINQKMEQTYAGLVGSTQEVLVEGTAPRGNYWRGHTPHGRNVLIPKQGDLLGKVVKLKISFTSHHFLWGEEIN